MGNRRRCLLLFRFSVETFAAHVYTSKRAKDKEKKSQKKYLSLFTKREGGVFLLRWEGQRNMFPGLDFFFKKIIHSHRFLRERGCFVP